MKQLKYKILLVLFIISFLSSFMLSIAHQTDLAFCDISSEDNGCGAVYNSTYGEVLGIQNSHIGVVVFFILAILSAYQIKRPTEQRREIIHTGTIIGSFVAIYFLYLQKFILQVYCKYCLIVDISILLTLAIIIVKWKE
ncbi:MAG: hypothetical protein KJ905_00370 [Nanoarchaeota archaeon]|nr:hypothetical protein [Nanoarchaeota archaeon]MBU2459075.1 hypothetical protein [Nanoarchaeota archaeon]